MSARNFVAERRQAAFRAISGKTGGASGRLLSPEVLQRAEAAMEQLAPAVLTEVETLAGRMAELAAAQQNPDAIFDMAHDIRGLADLCERPAAAGIAGVIRAYRFGAAEDFTPDWNLLSQLTGMLQHAMQTPETVPIEMVEQMCRQAVVKTMALEGRTATDQPW